MSRTDPDKEGIIKKPEGNPHHGPFLFHPQACKGAKRNAMLKKHQGRRQ
jgi:hypothetical protein